MNRTSLGRLISLAISALLIFPVVLSGCAPSDPQRNIIGNSAGNISNGGIAARQGDWIFYIDESAGGSIYKIGTGGNWKTKLNSEKSGNLNIVGYWVYYTNEADGFRIYRMRTDGSQKSKVLDESVNDFFCMADGWIYYQNVGMELVRAREDGTEAAVIGQYMAHLNFCGEKIIYVNNADGGRIYRMNADGTGAEKLNDYLSLGMVVDDAGKWIYFVDQNKNKISKIQTDGNYCTLISSDRASEINVAGEWVFYKNMDDYGKMYKMRTDGSEKAKMNDTSSSKINLAGDWVYYTGYSAQNSMMCRIRQDGSRFKLLGVMANVTAMRFPTSVATPTPVRRTAAVYPTPLPNVTPEAIIRPENILGSLQSVNESRMYNTRNGDGSVKAYVVDDGQCRYMMVDNGGLKVAAFKVMKDGVQGLNQRYDVISFANQETDLEVNIIYPLLNTKGDKLAFFVGINTYMPNNQFPGFFNFPGEIYIYDTKLNTIERTGIISTSSANKPYPYEWAASDDRLIIINGRNAVGTGTIVGLYTPGKGMTASLLADGYRTGNVTVSADRKTIAYILLVTSTRETELVFYDIETGKKTGMKNIYGPPLPNAYINISIIDFIDDENMLFYINSDLIIMNLATRGMETIAIGVNEAYVSADRKSIYYRMNGGMGASSIYIYDIAGKTSALTPTMPYDRIE